MLLLPAVLKGSMFSILLAACSFPFSLSELWKTLEMNELSETRGRERARERLLVLSVPFITSFNSM